MLFQKVRVRVRVRVGVRVKSTGATMDDWQLMNKAEEYMIKNTSKRDLQK